MEDEVKRFQVTILRRRLVLGHKCYVNLNVNTSQLNSPPQNTNELLVARMVLCVALICHVDLMLVTKWKRALRGLFFCLRVSSVLSQEISYGLHRSQDI